MGVRDDDCKVVCDDCAACSPHLAVDIDVDLAAYTEMLTVRCGYEGGPMVYGLLEVEGGDLAAGVMPAV
jgi:hypothetical protein